MADLIDRQAAIEAFRKELATGEQKGKYVTISSAVTYLGAKQILEKLPSAQPEIIQCVDCRWWKKEFGWNGAEYMVCALSTINRPIRNYYDFCSRAERREDG